MRKILSIKKASAIIIVGMFIFASNVQAEPSDGNTPTKKSVCDGLTGSAYSLCNVYCEAMDCDSDDHKASDTACDAVLERFLTITDSGVIPCEEVSQVVGSWQPIEDTDDGIWFSNEFAEGFDYCEASLYFGNISRLPIHSFIRFPNVTIPAGATIVSAVLRFTADYYNFSDTTPVNVKIYFNDADNPDAPTTLEECNDLILTDAIDWNNIDPWDVEEVNDSPELKTILQAVINRSGWASEQAILAVVKDNDSPDNTYRTCYEFNWGQAVELVVTYTLP